MAHPYTGSLTPDQIKQYNAYVDSTIANNLSAAKLTPAQKEAYTRDMQSANYVEGPGLQYQIGDAAERAMNLTPGVTRAVAYGHLNTKSAENPPDYPNVGMENNPPDLAMPGNKPVVSPSDLGKALVGKGPYSQAYLEKMGIAPENAHSAGMISDIALDSPVGLGSLLGGGAQLAAKGASASKYLSPLMRDRLLKLSQSEILPQMLSSPVSTSLREGGEALMGNAASGAIRNAELNTVGDNFNRKELMDFLRQHAGISTPGQREAAIKKIQDANIQKLAEIRAMGSDISAGPISQKFPTTEDYIKKGLKEPVEQVPMGLNQGMLNEYKYRDNPTLKATIQGDVAPLGQSGNPVTLADILRSKSAAYNRAYGGTPSQEGADFWKAMGRDFRQQSEDVAGNVSPDFLNQLQNINKNIALTSQLMPGLEKKASKAALQRERYIVSPLDLMDLARTGTGETAIQTAKMPWLDNALKQGVIHTNPWTILPNDETGAQK